MKRLDIIAWGGGLDERFLCFKDHLSSGVDDKYKPAYRTGMFTEKEPAFVNLTMADRGDTGTDSL